MPSSNGTRQYQESRASLAELRRRQAAREAQAAAKAALLRAENAARFADAMRVRPARVYRPMISEEQIRAALAAGRPGKERQEDQAP